MPPIHVRESRLVTPRRALALVVLSAAAVGAAYASAFLPGGAPAWAAWAMALGVTGSMLGTTALAVARRGRGLGRLALPLAVVALLLLGGFGAALALPAADPADPTLWLGLPPRAAIVLYGIGILPALVLPLAYARTFDEIALRPEELERARALRAAREAREGREPREPREPRAADGR